MEFQEYLKDLLATSVEQNKKYKEALKWLSDYMWEVIKDPDGYGFQSCLTADDKSVVELFKEILTELKLYE